MPTFRTGAVSEILEVRPGLQRVRVDLGGARSERAYVLTDLIGDVAVGDEVVCNTTAVDLGLGTGGWHVVHWNLARRTLERTGSGHIMKLRYTSLQADTGAAEEDHPSLPGRIDGIPVVVGTVHSQVPCVVVAALEQRPDLRIAYVMTDGAALPLALSDLVAAMTGADLLAGTVTAGHAFGGDLEAVGMASALTQARHVLGADLVVVAMGPGVVGTGTELGTTALEAAGVLDTADRLGGHPILCLRVSDGDERPRHRGVSHHAMSVLALTHSRVTLADDPTLTDPGATDGALFGHHDLRAVEAPDTSALLTGHGLTVTTMGRGPDADPAFFAAAGRAGRLAARLAP